MDTIESTIAQVLQPYGSLPDGGEAIVRDVVAALQQREYTIADDLAQAASSAGVVSESEARDVMGNVGLMIRPQVITTSDSTQGQERAVVIDLLDALARNRDAHRSQGQELDAQVAEVKRIFDI